MNGKQLYERFFGERVALRQFIRINSKIGMFAELSLDSKNIKNAQKMKLNHIASCALIRQKKYCQEIYDLSIANIDTNFSQTRIILLTQFGGRMDQSNKKFCRYVDSKLQFFYLKKVQGKMIAIKGLPDNASEIIQQMIGRIKPQGGRYYFEQVLIDDKDNLSPLSHNDFSEPDFLACSSNSLLVDTTSEHEYKIVSKELADDQSSCGPLYPTIYWLLGKLFAADPLIIAAYSFLDACSNIDDGRIPFDNFIINQTEAEKLLSTTRAIPTFHGVNVFTSERWKNHDPEEWECFDWMQTIEDAALLGAHKTGSMNLLDVRPNLEWLHKKFIEGKLKNIMDKI